MRNRMILMTINKKILMFGLTLLLLCPVLANAGAHVILHQITPEGSQARAWVQVAAWDENDTDLNPCYGWAKCYVGPDVFYRGWQPGLHGSCIVGGHCVNDAQIYRTRKQVMEAYKAKFPLPYNASFVITTADADCLGLAYASKIDEARGGDGQKFPGSTCGPLPPVGQTCSVSVNSNINFGTINARDLNNQYKEVQGTVSCTLPGTVNLHSYSSEGTLDVFMNSARTLYAEMMINDKTGSTATPVSTSGGYTPTPFRVGAKLRTTGANIDAGTYIGNAIVILSYM